MFHKNQISNKKLFPKLFGPIKDIAYGENN